MNTKLRTAYWIAISIFALWLVADGLAGLLYTDAGIQSFTQLGYPLYLLTIVGGAKLFAAAAILQNRYHTIKEWAYAGYAIDCLGAAASWYFVGITTNMVIALVFLALMFIPYTLWKKVG